MPSEAARDDALVRDLLAPAMDCTRINAAHDDRDAGNACCATSRVRRTSSTAAAGC
jgi:hypothetical protein